MTKTIFFTCFRCGVICLVAASTSDFKIVLQQLQHFDGVLAIYDY